MKETLSSRVLDYLESAEQNEPDVWLRDDLRIAWITVLLADRGLQNPHAMATLQVLGLHPDAVWSAIVARRKAKAGPYYEILYPNDSEFVGDLLTLPSKKPSSSVLSEIVRQKKVSGE